MLSLPTPKICLVLVYGATGEALYVFIEFISLKYWTQLIYMSLTKIFIMSRSVYLMQMSKEHFQVQVPCQ